MRVALFARVSSEEQAGPDKASLSAQLRVMRERCEREGWDVVRVFEAPGESAFTDDLAKRPVLLAAMEAAEAGEFDVLMCHESSRFARNAFLALALRRRLERAGVLLLEAGELVSTRTAEKGFFQTLNAGMNQFTSEKISEHTRKVKREQWLEGLHLGDPPFGYRRGGPRRPLEVVPGEAEAVALGFRDYVAGASYTEILSRWNEAGLVPRSKHGHTRFTVPAMQSIFESRVYAGFVSHKGEWRKGAHAAIVSESLWTQAQLRVRRRESRDTHRRLLSGVGSCLRCEGPLWLTNRKQGRFYYYREASGFRGERCEDAGLMVNAERVEAEFGALVESMTMDRGWLAGVAREALSPASERSNQEKVSKLVETKRRLGVAFADGALDEGEYRARMQRVERELGVLQSEPVSIAAVRAAGERLWDVGQLWRMASPERKRELPRLLFEKVLIDVRKPAEGSVLVKPWEEFAPYFRARVGCLVGPPGFGLSKQPTGEILFRAKALAS